MWVRGLKLGVVAHGVNVARSHPMWVRGLKHALFIAMPQYHVAPYVGAWIETAAILADVIRIFVAPYVGAWIETKLKNGFDIPKCRTLCGCVD